MTPLPRTPTARLVLLPITLSVLLLGTSAARSTSGAGGVRTLRTATDATALVADGPQVAVATACGPHFHELVGWNPVRRSVVSLARRRDRECYGSSTGEGILEVGSARGRFAWVHYDGGNYRRQWLVTATLRRPRSTTKLTEVRTHSTDGDVGDWVGNVHGYGSLLVFNTWSVCETTPDEIEPCPEGFPSGRNIYNEKLWRIVGRRKRLIMSSPDELSVLAVAAGRILVKRADGSLELRRADGRLLRVFHFEPEEVRGAVLDASELVVLDRASGLRWRVYDPASGERKRSLRATAGAFPWDVERGLLVYTVGRGVRVLRLADGRQRTFTTPRGTEYPLAQIEPSGLFYSYLVRHEGRVRFVPFNEIHFR